MVVRILNTCDTLDLVPNQNRDGKVHFKRHSFSNLKPKFIMESDKAGR